uniref:F5/8 type C domain-containing protein n=1 Tax=Magallana gigas TaxID=29159 RepID=A0A8W8P3H3_MAGGI
MGLFRIRYQNLSERSTTIVSQSSTYLSFTASRANDGNLSTTSDSCSHTGLNKAIAWFQVDLGKQFHLSNVKIHYRKDGNRSSDWKQYRFRQFYLDVSNISATYSTTTQRTRCYTDNTTYPDLPPNIIDIPCQQKARYVIVETTYDAPEDDSDALYGAILEICEIEVFGCDHNCINHTCKPFSYCDYGCVDGYWGTFCESLCPVNCREHNCTKFRGHCFSCNPGEYGWTCTSKCPSFCYGGDCDDAYGHCTHGCKPGRFGDTCNKICSTRCKNGMCNQESGICLGGCIKNWSGGKCNICDSMHYGSTCSLECSANCLNHTCNNETGLCTYGCREGFYGEQCEIGCDNCPSGCDIMTGQCIGDCPASKFGKFCHKTCSQDCKNGCSKYTGSCYDGCVPGKFGDFCNETCDVQYAYCCDKRSSNMKLLQDSTSENKIILIGVIVILCISVAVNGCTITWILRHKACKPRNVPQQETKTDSQTNNLAAQQRIYETTDDNAEYQELGHVSRTSLYDQLQRPQN